MSTSSTNRMRLLAAASAVTLAAGAIAVSPARSAVPPATPGAAWGTGTLTDANLHSLVSQMTLAEEFGMVHGGSDTTCSTSVIGCVGQAGTVVGVPRLGVPPTRLTDGPAGVRLSHVETAMPAPVGLTASFDRNAAQLFGRVVGDEGLATNQDVWLGPMTNAVSFITAGRNFETLGEDPYLAGELLGPEVKGVQGEGMIATLKHWIENDFENNRGSASVKIDDQTLHETELQAFEQGIKAGAGSVMCSYNRINDVYGCGNSRTLQEVLKNELGFKGYVMSDWGGTHRVTDLMHGLDLEMPSGSNFTTAALTAAVTSGTPALAATNDFPAQPAYSADQWKAALDDAVYRQLWAMNKASLLEGTSFGTHYTDGTPYVKARPDLSSLKSSSAAAAQSIAEESATLLKNDGKTLPLSSDDLSGAGTVVMGPTAIAPYTGGGGSGHVTPYDGAQAPYDALSAKAASGSKLSYVPGYDLDGTLVPSSALLAPNPAENYANWTLNAGDAAFAGQHGLLRQQTTTAAVASGAQPVAQSGGAADQLDPTVDATLPANTGWRWTGTLTAPSAGAWQLKIFVSGQASSTLFVDGLTTTQRRVNIGAFPNGVSSSYPGLSQTQKSHDPSAEGLQQAAYSVTLTSGQVLHLDLRAIMGATTGGRVQFRWVSPDQQAASIASAVSAAQAAKKAVIFAYDEGTEGSDRGGSNQGTGITLPGYQDQLIAAVAAAQPNTVVVLNTGDPVLMPWASSVKSILEMWYPGQMGGPATADILLGNTNPSGKLPETFPADATHFPTYSATCDNSFTSGNCSLYPGAPMPGFVSGNHSYPQVNQLDSTLGNGIYQGYRWYDKNNVTPGFAFGHGLSYTTFAFSNLAATPNSDGTMSVAFDVKNTGTTAGDEVPQVYVSAGPAVAGVQQSVKSLRGFDRITLAAGETKHETITLARRSFEYWNTGAQAWTMDTGQRTIMVGDASDNLPLSTTSTPIAAATSTTGGVGGSVPATLSLSLGTPAAFGAFTPGVAKDYSATTTATVISTAGDATLSVADPSSVATGHLVNGTFSLPSALGGLGVVKTWSAPTSNEAVPVTFTQHIGATDALRTGAYSKTLTFTLSTTNP